MEISSGQKFPRRNFLRHEKFYLKNFQIFEKKADK